MAKKKRKRAAKKSASKPKRCTARTKMGKQCKRTALSGGKLCSVHKRR